MTGTKEKKTPPYCHSSSAHILNERKRERGREREREQQHGFCTEKQNRYNRSPQNTLRLPSCLFRAVVLCILSEFPINKSLSLIWLLKCFYLPMVVDVKSGREAQCMPNLLFSQQLQHITEAPPLLYHLSSIVGEIRVQLSSYSIEFCLLSHKYFLSPVLDAPGLKSCRVWILTVV